MREMFTTFIGHPTRENYQALVEEVIAAPTYAPYWTESRDIAQLCDQGRWAAAMQKINECIPGQLLSPRLHLYRSLAFRHLGDVEAAQFEELIFRSCLTGILNTGDGTARVPYQVTSVSDEYDVLEYLGRTSQGQRLQEAGGRAYDVHQLADGGEIWFDITAPKKHLDALLSPPG